MQKRSLISVCMRDRRSALGPMLASLKIKLLMASACTLEVHIEIFENLSTDSEYGIPQSTEYRSAEIESLMKC